jgi:ElaB/YqjD/DUF883 family membrane-anchored ribosome-binding protein
MSKVQVGASHETIQDAIKQLKEVASQKEAELIERVSGLYDSLKESEGKAIKKAREAMGSVDKYVHQEPWFCIGGAALGGLLIGLFLRRK